jgi:curved DNA-binding protein CbpA
MYDFEQLDFYELLGIARTASPEEIKRAYRQQIARYHPDRHLNDPPEEQAYARERTQRISEAYRVLSDPAARNAYNRGQPLPSNRSGQRSARASATAGWTRSTRTGAANDQQADLYARGRAHLEEGRYAQAAAALRELQQLNPFYRDSAKLLAQAEAAMQEAAAREQAARASQPPQPTTRRPRWLLLGSSVLVVLLGVGLALLLLLPQLVAERMAVGDPADAPAATRTPAGPTSLSAFAAATAEAGTTAAEAMTAATAEARDEQSTATAAREATATAAVTPEPTPRPSRTLAPTREPTAAIVAVEDEEGTGEVLFQDTFADGGWASQQGNGWSVGYSNGAYRITTIPGIGNIWSYRTAFEAQEDFSLASDVQVLSGEAGLLFRFVDPQDYLAFLIDPERGRYRLQQHIPGRIRPLSQGRSDAIERGPEAINRMRVHLEDNEVQLFVNGELIDELTVEDISPTNVYGLVVNAEEETAEALFDNLLIRSLEDEG